MGYRQDIKMRIIFYPYKIGSASCRALSNAVSGLRVRANGRYRYRNGDVIFNWGATLVPNWSLNVPTGIINGFRGIVEASNKLLTFQALERANVPTVPFTTDREVASSWDNIVVRHILTGHGGNGIEIVVNDEELPQAPLYTKYIEPVAEYRVHVFDGKVIDYVKKRRRVDDPPEGSENYIRNLQNGWVFTRNNLRRLERVEQMAIDAVNALGLVFGAVDIIRDEENNCMVLEVNTACGLQGTTLEAYKNAILEYATKLERGTAMA